MSLFLVHAHVYHANNNALDLFLLPCLGSIAVQCAGKSEMRMIYLMIQLDFVLLMATYLIWILK